VEKLHDLFQGSFQWILAFATVSTMGWCQSAKSWSAQPGANI
jgi:hypothetical protein